MNCRSFRTASPASAWLRPARTTSSSRILHRLWSNAILACAILTLWSGKFAHGEVTIIQRNDQVCIPDNVVNLTYAITSVPAIPNDAIITKVIYSVYVFHTWPGDLELELHSPEGTQLLVWGGSDGMCGTDCGDDDDAAFDDWIELIERTTHAFDGEDPDDGGPGEDWELHVWDTENCDGCGATCGGTEAFVDELIIEIHWSLPAPPAPTALSEGTPSAPGEVIGTTTPLMTWTDVPAADTFEISISEFPYGSSFIIYQQAGLTGTSHVIPPGALFDGIDYRWNMVSINEDGVESAVSNTLYFQVEIDLPPPPAPTAVSEGTGSAPGEVIETATPLMTWTGLSPAHTGEISISEFPYGSGHIIYQQGGLTGTSHLIPPGELFDGIDYRWNMVAINEDGVESSSSNTLYFQVKVPTCPSGMISDCNGDCVSEALVGNGICNPNLDCAVHEFDGGDCSGGSSVQLVSPLKDAIPGRYGYGTLTNRGKFHSGLDLDSTDNAPVMAVASGVARVIPENTIPGHPDNYGMGNVVIIDHTDQMRVYSLYAHLTSDFRISHGEMVQAGEMIGFMGETGSGANGVHLHFELKHFNVLANLTDGADPVWGATPGVPNLYGYVNPKPYFDFPSINHMDPIGVQASGSQFVRTGPDISYTPTVTNVTANQRYVAFAKRDDWYQIYFPSIDGPATGWIQAVPDASATLFEVLIDDEDMVPDDDPTTGSDGGLNVRSEPTTEPGEKNVISKAWDRQVFTLLSTSRSGNGCNKAWYQITVAANADGGPGTGWVCSEYLNDLGGPPSTPGDLNGDGDVDGFDLALLLGAWGICPKTGDCPADLDGNGIVNGFDLAILLGAWG